MRRRSQESNFSSPDFLSRLKRRENEAISALVHAYTEQLLRTALGLGFDRGAARELVQNVWVSFFDGVAGFQGRSHVRTFIFGILYNKASELRKEQRRFQPLGSSEDSIDDHFDPTGHWIKLPVDPEAFLVGVQAVDGIRQCLDRLPLGQRMAFLMREVEERETEEVCNVLGVTATHLGVLIYRARKGLRECIEGKVRKRK